MNTCFLRRKLTLVVVAFLLAGVRPGWAAKTVARTEVFDVGAKTRIEVGTNHHAALANISVGDHVSVAYQTEAGKFLAHQISDDVPHKPHAPKEPATPKVPTTPKAPATPHAKKPSEYEHVRGVVKAVNVAGNTLTVEYKAK